MSVGVMEDYKLRDLRASHTLVEAVFLFFLFLFSFLNFGLRYVLICVSDNGKCVSVCVTVWVIPLVLSQAELR